MTNNNQNDGLFFEIIINTGTYFQTIGVVVLYLYLYGSQKMGQTNYVMVCRVLLFSSFFWVFFFKCQTTTLTNTGVYFLLYVTVNNESCTYSVQDFRPKKPSLVANYVDLSMNRMQLCHPTTISSYEHFKIKTGDRYSSQWVILIFPRVYNMYVCHIIGKFLLL